MDDTPSGVVLTASGLERVKACPASAVLPAILRTADAAERGKTIHRYLEDVLRGHSEADALVHVREDLRDLCRALDYRRATGDLADGLRPEVAFRVNVISGVADDLGDGLERGYPTALMGDIFGTTDVYGRRAWDDMPVVIDWKTGFTAVTPCRDNPQMKFAVVAVALLTGATEIEARIAMIRPSGRVDVDTHIFTAWDVDDALDEMAGIYDRVLGAKELLRGHVLPVLYPDDYCTYCPAYPACPAQTALARAMLDDVAGFADKLAVLTPRQAGHAYVKLKSFKRLYDMVDKAIKTMAKASPLPIDAEHEVREITFPRRSFDQGRALELLHELGATEEQIATCEPKVIVSQVRECKARRSA